MRRLGVGVLVALALLTAGCFGDDGPSIDDSATAGSPDEGGGGETVDTKESTIYVPLLDRQTLYVEGQDSLGGVAPNSSDPERLVFPGGPTSSRLVWSYVMEAPAKIDGGEAVFWIEVSEDSTATAPGGPYGRFCPWNLGMTIHEPGVVHYISGGCPSKRLPFVEAGVHEVRFQFDLLESYPVDLPAGAEWEFSLTANLESVTGNPPPAILYGSVEHSSSITLDGLREPFPEPERVVCDGTYERSMEERRIIGPSYTTPLFAAGTGFGLDLRNVTGLQSLHFQAKWEATTVLTERLEIRIYLENETRELEGPPVLETWVMPEGLANNTRLSGSIYLSGEGMPVRSGVVSERLVLSATMTLMCPSVGSD